MVRILILSFYYPPDLSAGSFRMEALVNALAAETGPQDHLHILTSAPNRYASYSSVAPAREEYGNVTIERITVPAHKSGFRDQALAFASFARGVLKHTRGMQADVVFATSSRLMTAALGGLVARRLGARLHLDIRDLLRETLGDILKGPARLLLPLFSILERWTLRQADAISIVSPGFEEHVRNLRPDVEPSLRTNGVDCQFLGFEYHHAGNHPPVILYAGNIGEGQGLEHIIPRAARQLSGHYAFRIIGDGGRRRALETALVAESEADHHPLAVEILPPVDRTSLLEHYARADILLLHLNDYPAFRRVLPSKLFEYAATGKPVLAGVAGVAANFIEEHVTNAAVFAPCDSDGMLEALEKLSPVTAERTGFTTKFSRENIVRALARDILALARQAR